MDNNINDIICRYKNNKCISIYSDKHFPNDNFISSIILSIHDVAYCKTKVVDLINYYTKIESDLCDDILKQIEQVIGVHEIAVHKALNEYGLSDFNCKPEELQQLVYDIYDDYNQFAEIRLKKLCQKSCYN